jgi:CheY-like chemotaxis protein
MSLDGVRVLLVDDDPSILRAFSLFLACSHAHVDKARDATEAFSSYETHRPDVIVADYAMPGKTGIEFLQQVRSRERSANTRTPAILISAIYGLDAAARAAGFDSYLTKPLDPDGLVSEIARLAKQVTS